MADFMPWFKRGISPDEPFGHQQFWYEVTLDDNDADGIAIHADALDFSEGSIFTEAGVEIAAAEIYAASRRTHSTTTLPSIPGSLWTSIR